MSTDFNLKLAQTDSSIFSELEHTADYALRIRGRNFTELLCNSAIGLYYLMGPVENNGAGLIRKRIALAAQDAEGLLVEWLSELSFWAEESMFVATEIRFSTVSKTNLAATICGTSAGALEKIIKAVTYHDLKILETPEGLTATVVFDV